MSCRIDRPSMPSPSSCESEMLSEVYSPWAINALRGQWLSHPRPIFIHRQSDLNPAHHANASKHLARIALHFLRRLGFANQGGPGWTGWCQHTVRHRKSYSKCLRWCSKIGNRILLLLSCHSHSDIFCNRHGYDVRVRNTTTNITALTSLV